MCERELRTNGTATYRPPLYWPSAFPSRSPGLLNRRPGGPASLGAGFLYRILSPLVRFPTINRGPEGSLCWVLAFSTASCLQLVSSPNWLIGGLRAPSAVRWFSLPHLVSDLSRLQTALSYIIVQHPPSSCGRHNFALIQPAYGQGYNILIDRMHQLFIQVHFLFWQPGWVEGQYTTVCYINNIYLHMHVCMYSYILMCGKEYISSSSCRASSTDIPDPLSPLLSLSFIASGRSSGLHPVSSHSCWL